MRNSPKYLPTHSIALRSWGKCTLCNRGPKNGTSLRKELLQSARCECFKMKNLMKMQAATKSGQDTQRERGNRSKEVLVPASRCAAQCKWKLDCPDASLPDKTWYKFFFSFLHTLCSENRQQESNKIEQSYVTDWSEDFKFNWVESASIGSSCVTFNVSYRPFLFY